MLNLKSIIYIVFLSLIVIGCGDQGSFNSKPIINVNNDTNISNNSISFEHVQKSLESIKHDLGSMYVRAYVAKENNDAFVVKGSRLWGSSLLHYDISQSEPIFKKIIREAGEPKITNVLPLSNGKIIYIVEPPVSQVHLGIYDYKLQEKLSTQILELNYTIDINIYLDPTEKFIQVNEYTVDISDIYRPKLNKSLSLEEKFQEILGNNFVKLYNFQDYTYVVERNPNNGENIEKYNIKYNYSDTEQYKITHINRVATLFENHIVTKVFDLSSNKIAYVSLDLTAPENLGYSIVVYDTFKNIELSAIFLKKIYNWDDSYISTNDKYSYILFAKKDDFISFHPIEGLREKEE